jgi:hypothetical protein
MIGDSRHRERDVFGGIGFASQKNTLQKTGQRPFC